MLHVHVIFICDTKLNVKPPVWFVVPSSAYPIYPISTYSKKKKKKCLACETDIPECGVWSPQQQVSPPSCCRWTSWCPTRACWADSLRRTPSATSTGTKPGCPLKPHEWCHRCRGRREPLSAPVAQMYVLTNHVVWNECHIRADDKGAPVDCWVDWGYYRVHPHMCLVIFHFLSLSFFPTFFLCTLVFHLLFVSVTVFAPCVFCIPALDPNVSSWFELHIVCISVCISPTCFCQFFSAWLWLLWIQL